ncbi:MAG: NAD-dependent epimerase/dehydratase family protein [Acidobacteriota bacterium]|nr:NAD-dependent epimerase/dehydratase family protein [Acidobacteriota bacterium]
MGSKFDRLAGQGVLVTGAAGFLGRNLTGALLAADAQVIALVRSRSNAGRLADIAGKASILECDLRQAQQVKELGRLQGIRYVFHLAAGGADGSQEDPSALIADNVVATGNLLQCASQWKLDRFVYSGSCFEYRAGKLLPESTPPDPRSIYAATKSAATLLVQAYARTAGMPAVVLRLFTPYGPWEAERRLIPYVIQSALKNAEIRLTSGAQTRDFVYVEDAIEAMLVAAVHPQAANGVYNVCGGKATSVQQVVKTVLTLTGSSSVVHFGALPHRATELWTISGSPRHTKRRLGWSAATPLREGLKKTICWFRSQGARAQA